MNYQRLHDTMSEGHRNQSEETLHQPIFNQKKSHHNYYGNKRVYYKNMNLHECGKAGKETTKLYHYCFQPEAWSLFERYEF